MKELSILSAGAVTSVGLSLAATSAAIRAALDNFQETRFLGPDGEPLMGARVDLRLPQEEDGSLVGGAQRFTQMVSLAVEECLLNQDLNQDLALLLVLPDAERPLDHEGLRFSCECACTDRLARRPTRVSAYTQGAYGVVPALQEARELLRQGRVQRALIVGVDSWLSTPSIQQALAQGRLLTSEKAEGFIPGEGAAALLVGASDGGPHLAVRGLGSAKELATLASEEPCTGKGLSKALTEALSEASLQAYEMHLRVSLTSGEEYFFTEGAYAWSRLLRQPQPLGHQFLLPASSLGDIGAAAGVTTLAHLWHVNRIQRHHGPNTIIYLSSTHEQRGGIATVAH